MQILAVAHANMHMNLQTIQAFPRQRTHTLTGNVHKNEGKKEEKRRNAKPQPLAISRTRNVLHDKRAS